MKTKIVYISGNELFDIADIRAAFEEVRNALGLDSQTVLFGVPVDNEDAGLGTQTEQTIEEETPVVDSEEDIPEENEEEIEEEADDDIIEETHEIVSSTPDESIEETTPKKRGRPRKVPLAKDEDEETVSDENTKDASEKIVPILSILSNEETKNEEQTQDLQGIDYITSEIDNTQDTDFENEPDLEKLLSKMKPLEEDLIEEKENKLDNDEDIISQQNNINVDATLQQLANEFAESQDAISTEKKPVSHGKIGKLRNIFPFKQSKRKDQSIGDLFEWGGIAANDEDFSVPGFFTSAASKK